MGSFSKRDINILKLIVAAGLYPNVAISDDANYARPISEHVYHSKMKRFLTFDIRFLHIQPNSVFAFSPELIDGQLVDATVSTDADNLDSLHGRVVCKELLCFQQLLETTKPFIVNATRVGALHLCLILAKSGIQF